MQEIYIPFERKKAIIVFVVLSTIAVFMQVGGFEFLEYDDNDYVFENYHILSGMNIPNVIWAFTSGHSGNWHPITWISHMLDIHFFGMKSGMHHYTNLVFHILNTALLFYLFLRMTRREFSSGIIALLFAVHPLHIESVAWIAERKDVLSVFWGLLALHFYVSYIKSKNIIFYFLLLTFFIFSLMSKPMFVTLPFLILVLDFWPLQRMRKIEFKFLFVEKLPLIFLSMFSSFVTYHFQKIGGAVGSIEKYPLSDRIANAAISYLLYLYKMIWPSDLTAFYPYSPTSIFSFSAIAAILLLLAMISMSLFYLNQKPYFITGLLWYLGTMIPVIGLVQVGTQSMADRYTYFPLIGIFLILVWRGAEFIEKRIISPKKKCAIALLATMPTFTVLLFVSWKQVTYWENNMIFYQHMINVTHNNYKAYNGLGIAFLNKANYSDAVDNFNKAIALKSDYMSAYNNLAIAYMDSGNISNAIQYFEKASQIKQDDPVTLTNYGVALAKNKDLDGAIDKLTTALEIRPSYVNAHYNLSLIYLKDKFKSKEGVLHLKKVLDIVPHHTDARYNLANYMLRSREIDAAVHHFLILLEGNPDDADAHNQIGIAFATKGELKKAQYHFKNALSIDPSYVEAKNNLLKLRNIVRKLD